MFFNSLTFLAFFAVCYLLYWHVPDRWRHLLLLVFSLVFYGWWDRLFLVHFLTIVVLNYFLFQAIRQRRNKAAFYLMLALNLGNLLFFKYAAAVLRLLGEDLGINLFSQLYEQTNITLPLAISFYSFQIMALGIDAWRGEIQENIAFPNYVLFVMFFPQLIAGPIMRHSDFFHQLRGIRFDESRMFVGIYLILFGLVKKGFIGDNIAGIIDPVYADPLKYSAEANIAAAFGFALQLYLDFSGYTDMARGIAKMLGYEIPENFRAPYFSQTFSEHWRRWHITLSTWLRDYLYIPLGGNRAGPGRTNLNLFLTMSLGGLWHGHNFTYLVWGMLEGAYLVIERKLGLTRQVYKNIAARVGVIFVVFIFSTIARVFFRADTIGQALDVFTGMFAGGSELPENFAAFYRFFLFGVIAHTLQYYQTGVAPYLVRWRYWLVPLVAIVTLFLFARLQIPGVSFIYFQF